MIKRNIRSPKSKSNVRSAIDMYNRYISNKVDSSDIYFIKKNILYKDNSKILENLKVKLKKLEESKSNIILDKNNSEYSYEIGLEKELCKVIDNISYIKRRINKVQDTLEPIIKVIDYKVYKKIISVHNKTLQDYILLGHSYRFIENLGYLYMKCVDRNYKNKKVDFNATRKRKKSLLSQGVLESDLYHSEKNPEGKIKYAVYFTDPDWIRLGWRKGAIKNIKFYEFIPSGGQKGKGFKNKISSTVKNNPTLKTLFHKD